MSKDTGALGMRPLVAVLLLGRISTSLAAPTAQHALVPESDLERLGGTKCYSVSLVEYQQLRHDSKDYRDEYYKRHGTDEYKATVNPPTRESRAIRVNGVRLHFPPQHSVVVTGPPTARQKATAAATIRELCGIGDNVGPLRDDDIYFVRTSDGKQQWKPSKGQGFTPWLTQRSGFVGWRTKGPLAKMRNGVRVKPPRAARAAPARTRPPCFASKPPSSAGHPGAGSHFLHENLLRPLRVPGRVLSPLLQVLGIEVLWLHPG